MDLIRLEDLEPRRGCGYRYVGKLYLVGKGISVGCHRLPLEIPDACPVCGAKIKFHRGIQRIDFRRIFGGCKEIDKDYPCHITCPVCNPPGHGWLMWVGSKFYPRTIDFVEEAERIGISKAIARLPGDFKLGEDWVYLAHKKAVRKKVEDKTTLTGYKEVDLPGIFYAFKPERVEMLVRESEATEEKLKELQEKGITPVVVPDDWEERVEKAEKKKRKRR